jgi:hypothetical protein
MTGKEFKECMEETLARCVGTWSEKAGEYATSDRLHNFKVAGAVQGTSPLSALAGMMAKHTVSIYDLVGKSEYGTEIPIEMWDEKIGDHINYLILMRALLEEEYKMQRMGEEAGLDD